MGGNSLDATRLLPSQPMSGARARMRLTVIGTGYLGLTHAVCMAELGHEVLALDVDHAKVTNAARGTRRPRSTVRRVALVRSFTRRLPCQLSYTSGRLRACWPIRQTA
jgi:UDP-N-acetyl-D-mannosaminuronate dehydrogenase